MAKKPELKGAFAKMLAKDNAPATEIKTKKISCTYTYDPELIKQVKVFCAEKGIFITDFIDAALRQHLKNNT